MANSGAKQVLTHKPKKQSQRQKSATSERKDDQVKGDPFDDWAPSQRALARDAYLEYAEELAEGAEALHTVELALVKACRALPAVYRMVIPATLGNVAFASLEHRGLENRGIEEAEKLLGPVFSQLPLLLKNVRAAGGCTSTVVREQVKCPPEDCPGVATFVQENTRLPQIHNLGTKWDDEVFNATNR